MAAIVNNSAKVFSNGNVTNLSTASFAIGGSNRVLYVAVGSGAGTPIPPVSVKWGGSGGTALTQVSTTLNAGGNGRVSLWRLTAPAATSSTVYVDWGTNQDETLIIAVAVEDADQTTPNGTIATATGNATSPTVNATAVVGDLVLDFTFFLDGNGNAMTFTVGSGQTSLQEIDGADLNFEGMAASRETAAGTSVTMDWTIGGASLGNTDWGSYAFAVNGGGAPPASTSLSARRRNTALMLQF